MKEIKPFLAWSKFRPIEAWDSKIPSALAHKNMKKFRPLINVNPILLNLQNPVSSIGQYNTWNESGRRWRRSRETQQNKEEESSKAEAEALIQHHACWVLAKQRKKPNREIKLVTLCSWLSYVLFLERKPERK